MNTDNDNDFEEDDFFLSKKGKITVGITGVILFIVLNLYFLYPVYSGITKEYSLYMTVIDKRMIMPSETIHGYMYSSGFISISKTAESAKYMLKTSRPLTLYKKDQYGNQYIYKEKTEIKEYEVPEDIYESCTIGSVFTFESDSNKWILVK